MAIDFSAIHLAQSFLLLRLYTDDKTFVQVDMGRSAKNIYTASVKLLQADRTLYKAEWVAVALSGETTRILLVTHSEAFPWYIDTRERFGGPVTTQRFCKRSEALKIYKDLLLQDVLCSGNIVKAGQAGK